jgi:MFS family permease
MMRGRGILCPMQTSGSRALAIARIFLMAWVLIAGAIFTGLIGPVRSSIQETFGIDEAQFSLWLAAVQFVSSGVVLAAAPRLGRLNPMKLMVAGLAVSTLGLFVCYRVPTLAGWLGGWSAVSFGRSLGAIANNIAMDLWPDRPRRGVVLLHAWNSGGKVLGPIVVALTLGWFAIQWRGSFLALAVLSAALLGFFSLTGGPTIRHMALPKEEVPAPSHRAFRNPLFWHCATPFALIAGSEAAFSSLAPLYFERMHGMTREVASLLLTVHVLGLMCGRFAVGLFGERLSNRTIIGICVGAGVALFPCMFIADPYLVSIPLFVYGLTFSATWPTFYAQAARFIPEDRDMLAYTSQLANLVGISACIALSGYIARQSLPWSLVFSVAVMWVFALWFYLGPVSGEPEGS